jgi:hypothetical protein
VNTRTKETALQTEVVLLRYAAQSSAQGKVQEKGFQLLCQFHYNINNIPTYVMTLKDKGENWLKCFAMVAIF